MSYAIPKKQGVVQDLQKALSIVTPIIMNDANPLLEVRLTLFLGYYIDILYIGDEEIFLQVLKMLITSINSKNIALAHQSTDTLKTIISDRDLIP